MQWWKLSFSLNAQSERRILKGLYWGCTKMKWSIEFMAQGLYKIRSTYGRKLALENMKNCHFHTTKSLYFLKYLYTGLSVWTTVCRYDIKKYFQKYNWKCHWKCHLSTVLGTVIKCPKGTGSASKTLYHKKLYFWQSIYNCVKFIK